MLTAFGGVSSALVKREPRHVLDRGSYVASIPGQADYRILTERGVNILRDYFGTFCGCSVNLVLLRSDLRSRAKFRIRI